MNNITVEETSNYPVINGAALLGEIANKRIRDYWVQTGTLTFPPVNEILLDILVEDFNERHKGESLEDTPNDYSPTSQVR